MMRHLGHTVAARSRCDHTGATREFHSERRSLDEPTEFSCLLRIFVSIARAVTDARPCLSFALLAPCYFTALSARHATQWQRCIAWQLSHLRSLTVARQLSDPESLIFVARQLGDSHSLTVGRSVAGRTAVNRILERLRAASRA